MNEKILVANRAEIACRIFQAAREMGIPTVGVFTSTDELCRHVTYADEVYEVSSYLDPKEMLRVARESQATLVHPGYGFLSEKAVFAQMIEDAGIRFVGPRAETMELMGEKIAAKKFSEKNKVPTLPWAEVKNPSEMKKEAKRIGFPLLMKAAAGGGGKGMRLVRNEAELAQAAESASSEALSAFGEGTLFMEKFLPAPRHIEVQVFGNGSGEGVTLFERECTLQRRHQKIWEEAPAFGISSDVRKKLSDAALRLVKATQYRNAGTVEFLMTEEEESYFLEMNTRLQVEHPVTESVSGLDLVREQIECALGKKTLPNCPSRPFGFAIEVRIYAEDPSAGFIPSPGEILALHWPLGPGIRVDSGIEVGQKITTDFDSLLAKLIVWGSNRDQALARMRDALSETVILGVGTNQNYLLELTRHSKVQKGKVDTGFLEREFQFQPEVSEQDIASFQALKGTPTSEGSKRYPSPWEVSFV